MIYFILTSCIMDNSPAREREYYTAYAALECAIQKYNIQDTKIIFVENNGKRETYLDELGCDVFYTNNNSLPVKNKGYKEIRDVLDCIAAYNIQDTDFVVKLTGRYIVERDSPFMAALQAEPLPDCIIKYSNYFTHSPTRIRDCLSGLVGMKCAYIKHIELPSETEAGEWKWAGVTYLINEERIINLSRLGLFMHMDSATLHHV